MSGRDPDEAHRASTPLELFFDLCFVVAVAAAAETLHHDLAQGLLSGLAGYAMVFFAIWWAWVNYSWFASAYDTDDVIFRLLTFVVMAGVLVVAAGAPRAAGEEHNFWIVVVGYLIMRVAMLPLWLRVAREHPDHRRTALRYAAAIAVIQLLWVLRTISLADGAWGGCRSWRWRCWRCWDRGGPSARE
jgi:low temperature requirement protein LtrA